MQFSSKLKLSRPPYRPWLWSSTGTAYPLKWQNPHCRTPICELLPIPNCTTIDTPNPYSYLISPSSARVFLSWSTPWPCNWNILCCTIKIICFPCYYQEGLVATGFLFVLLIREHLSYSMKFAWLPSPISYWEHGSPNLTIMCHLQIQTLFCSNPWVLLHSLPGVYVELHCNQTEW